MLHTASLGAQTAMSQEDSPFSTCLARGKCRRCQLLFWALTDTCSFIKGSPGRESVWRPCFKLGRGVQQVWYEAEYLGMFCIIATKKNYVAPGTKYLRILLKQMFTGCWVIQIIMGSLLPGNLPYWVYFKVIFCTALTGTRECVSTGAQVC